MPAELIAELVIRVLLKYGPDLAETVYRIFNNKEPITDATWKTLFAEARKKPQEFIDSVKNL